MMVKIDIIRGIFRHRVFAESSSVRVRPFFGARLIYRYFKSEEKERKREEEAEADADDNLIHLTGITGSICSVLLQSSLFPL